MKNTYRHRRKRTSRKNVVSIQQQTTIVTNGAKKQIEIKKKSNVKLWSWSSSEFAGWYCSQKVYLWLLPLLTDRPPTRGFRPTIFWAHISSYYKTLFMVSMSTYYSLLNMLFGLPLFLSGGRSVSWYDRSYTYTAPMVWR